MKYRSFDPSLVRLRKYARDQAPLPIFLGAYNLASLFRQKTPRCKFSSKSKKFKLRKSGLVRYASTRSRAITYYDGFQSRANYIADTYFINKLDFASGDVIVDCGANMGDLLLWFDLNGIEVEYHGFEPNPVDFDCLIANSKKGACYNLGLWSSSSVLEFYVSTEVASSSFIEPPYYSEIIKVPTKRLDSMGFKSRIKLLKLEAEGAEPEVLEGARDLLPLIEYISADVGPERGPSELSTRNEVVFFLEKNNFEIIYENTGHRKTVLLANKRLNSETSK